MCIYSFVEPQLMYIYIFYLILVSELISHGEIDFIAKYSIAWMDAINIYLIFAFILFLWLSSEGVPTLIGKYKYFIILIKVIEYWANWACFGPSQFLEYF